MKPSVIIFSLAILMAGCHSATDQGTTKKVTATDSVKAFFPVTSFIKGQFIVLDSMPLNPLRIVTVNGKSDSAWVKKEELRGFLHPFLTPVIDTTNLQSLFSESSFNDLSVDAITFAYEPKAALPDSLSLRSWNVYINPRTGNVTKVYIVKEFKENGQLITQQLTWQTETGAKINTILNKPDGNFELLKEETISWSFEQ